MAEMLALGVEAPDVMGAYLGGRKAALGERQFATEQRGAQMKQARDMMQMIGSVALGSMGGKLDGEPDPQLYEQGLDFLQGQGIDVSKYRGKPQLAKVAARGSLDVLQAINLARDNQEWQLKLRAFDLQMAQAAMEVRQAAIKEEREAAKFPLEIEALKAGTEKAKAEAGKAGAPNFDDEIKLSKDFQDVTKDFRQVRDSYTRIQSSAQNPSAAGDLALIFNYMKMLDPGSVVRESEFATAQNSAGVPDRIRNIYNKVLSGERLAPEQRRDFVARSGQLYEGQLNQYRQTKEDYRKRSIAYGFNPERVLGDFEPPAGTSQDYRNEIEKPVDQRRSLIDDGEIDALIKKYGQ